MNTYNLTTSPNTQAHVIKIGGENASDARTAEWLANFHNNGNHTAVAISALRACGLNTTDELIRARQAFDESGDMTTAIPILENLYNVHIETLRSAGMYDSELDGRLRELFEHTFPRDFSLPSDLIHGSMSSLTEQRFIGYGEVMSAQVLEYLLRTRYQVATHLITDTLDTNDSSLSNTLQREVGRRVAENIRESIVIVPGYVSVRDTELVPTYGRGYTDKTAERIAVGLANNGYSPSLHIQKQVALLSSNPQNIPGAQVVPHLTYYSAGEITGARGANARVLNEHTITQELRGHDIPVLVYNPFEKNAPVSTISASGSAESGILFVDGRENVSTITLSGFGMVGAGLLAPMTSVFGEYDVSIDSISSSETEVTFTTYRHLTEYEQSELLRKLSSLFPEYDVNISNNLGMIYCIGDNLAGHPGLTERIGHTLAQAGIDIECTSQSRGQRAVTLGVASNNLRRAVELLHETLVENKS